jgi:hypothetical protein
MKGYHMPYYLYLLFPPTLTGLESHKKRVTEEEERDVS